MKRIVPITDLQRQAGQLVSGFVKSDEPVIITQRGRAAAVLMSVSRYSQIEEDLQRLDELELLEMVHVARQAKSEGKTISHDEVKRRLGLSQKTTAKKQSNTKRMKQ
jgi:prevent-host-death family protein